MKTTDGYALKLEWDGGVLGFRKNKRMVLELPPGGVTELLQGLQTHTSPALENYAATETGEEVGLAVKANAVLFFKKGRRVFEISNTDLPELVSLMRRELPSADSVIETSAVVIPSSRELLASKKYLEAVQVERYQSEAPGYVPENTQVEQSAKPGTVAVAPSVSGHKDVWVLRPNGDWECIGYVIGLNFGNPLTPIASLAITGREDPGV